jgi:VanZ family protein
MDKWIHAIMYLVLTLTLLWDSQQRPKLWWIVGVFSAIFGGFIEVLQEQFFYPRTGDWMDWLADCIGVIVAIIVWLIGVKWYEKRMVK